MIGKIIGVTVYAVVFVVVTGVIVIMNSKYNNIFLLNFSPPASEKNYIPPGIKIDLIKIHDALESKLRSELIYTVKAENEKRNASTEVIPLMDSTVYDSLNELKLAIQKLEKDTKIKVVKETENEENIREQKKYQAWLKATSGLYESMEPNRAAKIIIKYSDNIAKDLIYNMKKKQAAEILVALDPKVASRITRAER